MRRIAPWVIGVPLLFAAKVASAEVTSDVDLHLYGYLRGSVAWDSARLDNATFPRWVQNRPADRELALYANDTRLGVDLDRKSVV